MTDHMIDTDALIARLNAGETICNVGNWTKAARAWVARAERRGDLMRRSTIYPKRHGYIATGPVA